MGLTHTMLRPVAALGGMRAARHVRAFLAAHQRTREVQEALLIELVRRHADTAFGRDHDLARVRSVEAFRSAVPVRTYERLRPYMDRVFAGETGALLPADEKVLMFSMTSGTTGEPKHIPVTGAFLRSMRRGWNIFGLLMLRDHPDGWLRAILPISSPMDDSSSPTGVPCGAISGLLAATQLRIVRRMYVVPPEVARIRDPACRFYTTLRCGVGRDVGIISTANPSSIIKLIEAGQDNVTRLIRDVADGTLSPPGDVDPAVVASLRPRPDRPLAKRIADGVRRDGRLLPTHFWNPAFLTHWTGGTLRLYLPRLREMFGEVPIRDIGLLASEGRFSIPIHDGTPAGIAEITGNFLEFIPADEHDREDPPTLGAHELQTGGEYFLVVTNCAGLWRYDLGDRVRVTGHYGSSPIFEFLSRGEHTASITGEKITEHQVVRAMAMTSEATGQAVEQFLLQGRFARTPYYELRLELADGVSADRIAQRMDETLRELNIEYHSKRSSGRLGAVRAILLPDGTLRRRELEAIGRRGGRSEQYKHQYLLSDFLPDEGDDETET